ncbi:hypothetical protein XELAEV_18041807mg, partial [Xenopus laevis]
PDSGPTKPGLLPPAPQTWLPASGPTTTGPCLLPHNTRPHNNVPMPPAPKNQAPCLLTHNNGPLPPAPQQQAPASGATIPDFMHKHQVSVFG